MKRKDFIQTTLAATAFAARSPLSVEAGRPKTPFVVEAGRGRFNESFRFRGINLNDIKISKSDTCNQLSIFEYTGNEKIGPPLHVHFSQDEIFYVVEGEYKFIAGEEVSVLKAGDTIFLPRNVAHTWIQLSDKGKLLYFVQPSGSIEEFFRKMNALTTPPTEEEAQKLHMAHGIKILGPPLSL